MKKRIVKTVLFTLVAVLLIAAAVFAAVYTSRIKTVASVKKLTSYADGYNLYRMDIKYDYDLDEIIASDLENDQDFLDAVIDQALPYLPVSIKAPNFACSAFTMQAEDGNVMMGRNYDFSKNTSSMLVYCAPSEGYKSVAFCALDNIGANDATGSLKAKLATLTAPFVCLDGMNEKGVSIAVLTLDSEPTRQSTGKPAISTTLAIRLVLDRAATTEEAVQLLEQYDMHATSGRDYHFYITDASGDGRVIEYDCESESRPLVATKTRTITNFFALYREKVTGMDKNGIYGHGLDRYLDIEKVFDTTEVYTKDTAWEALRAASQLPDPTKLTSNTQWSIVYDNTTLTAEIVLRRNWNDVTVYDLKANTIEQ